MIGLTVCSGIGAPELSAPWIDWRWQSEIEPFPCAVLRERFPGAVNLGDMTQWEEWPDATVDVLCGGTPCQSFSIAGLRAGLADPRGNLMLTYLAIARRYRPRWVVWENVPGVLSSNGGRDFGALLRGLGELGYGFAYRVLDAQYVRTRSFPRAVPQRRRRVFVVGYPGDWRRAAAVLFDRESLQGHPPPRREAGQGVARAAAEGAAICSGNGWWSKSDVAATVRAQDSVTKADTLIPETAHSLRGEGFDASEDGTGRETPLIAAPVASTLNAAFGDKQGLEDQHVNSGCPLFVAQPIGFNARQDPDAWIGHTATLDTHGGTQAVAFSCKDYGADAGETAPTLRAMGHAGSHANAGGQVAVAFDTYNSALTGNVTHTLRTAHPEGTPAISTPYAVRRLMPVECERLMGFPDHWTAIPWRGKPSDQCPDGPRYKALGNSWAVNCGEWIFDNIRRVEAVE